MQHPSCFERLGQVMSIQLAVFLLITNPSDEHGLMRARVLGSFVQNNNSCSRITVLVHHPWLHHMLLHHLQTLRWLSLTVSHESILVTVVLHISLFLGT